MKKLVLYGDSLFGQISKSRTAILEGFIGDYDIYNCATNGWNTDDCLKKAPYISKLEPDLLVVSLGTNDAAPYKLVPIERFADNIPKILAYFPKSKVIYFLPPPVDENKTKLVGKALKNSDIKPYHDKAKQICEELGIAHIDSFSVFKPLIDGGEDYHIEDGIHLTDRAYEIIAKELSKLLV